jgi:hypothetical protein
MKARDHLKTTPELAKWIERHGSGGLQPERSVPDAPQLMLFERNPAAGHAPRRLKRPATSRWG